MADKPTLQFRVKDLLINSIDESGQGRINSATGCNDTYCPTAGPCTICTCTNCTDETLYCKNTACCCPGWTAQGTTKVVHDSGLSNAHLSALRDEIRAAVADEFRRARGESVEERAPLDPLQVLETRLTEALDEVRARRKLSGQ